MNKGLTYAAATLLTAALLTAAHADSFTDQRDGKPYRTVKIGGQTWMAENLNFKAVNSRCYADKEANCKTYGQLYDWNTAMSACPAGWRLPARKDWNDLASAAGGEEDAGKNLKSKTGWNDWVCDRGMLMDGRDCTLAKAYTGNGTDRFGFSAAPGGSRIGNEFDGIGGYANWWSNSKNPSGLPHYWGIMDSHNEIVEIDIDESVLTQFGASVNDFKNALYSVRCVQE